MLYKKGLVVRSFQRASGVACRGWSLPLQRRAVDFGADGSFAQASRKLQEHYGITVPASSLRLIVEGHGAQMERLNKRPLSLPPEGKPVLIAQTDGCMVPLVESLAPPGTDRRKNKNNHWKEVRLCFTRTPQGDPYYGAVLGSVDELGDCWRKTAIKSGMGQNTHLHCLGDGATWILDQLKRIFGSQASYLLDFFHLSEYLGEAARRCSGRHRSKWLAIQQERLRHNHTTLVLAVLAAKREPSNWGNPDAPVRCAHRYLSNRLDQVDYRGALRNDLPIGSGEIESGNRSVVQARLKKPGAWWVANNCRAMVSLSLCRANSEWEAYWKDQQCKKVA